MIGRLHKAHGVDALIAGALEHGFHQPAADAAVLSRRIDGDRSYAGDTGILPQEVAADHAPVDFGHHAMNVRARQQMADQADGNLAGRKVGRESMLFSNGFEGGVADRSGGHDVSGRGGAQGRIHQKLP